jgi:hypothetical protein
MFIITKKVLNNKYYWNKKKFEWNGLVENAVGFDTKRGAESYLNVYKNNILKDAVVEKVEVKVESKKVDFKFRK